MRSFVRGGILPKPVAKLLLVMKLITIFILGACLQVAASGYSQKVALNVKDAPLSKVLKEIKQQTKYVFLYADKEIAAAKPVTANLQNVALPDALKEIFKDQPLSYEIQGKTIFVSAKKNEGISGITVPMTVTAPLAAPIRITGIVTDQDSKPLQGATVKVKGGTAHALTNEKGEFTINVAENSSKVLVVSFIGMADKEISVGVKNASVKISLTRSYNSQQDVVVVGFATQKKVNVTGAVTQVSGEVFENKPIVNVTEGLQGVVPNLNIAPTSDGGAPGASMNINIRGFTGLGQNGSPLIVIDGVPSANMNYLAPGDIESISVLKDAASSSIYGSRGPYGVILITTKKGKRNQTMTVNYSNLLSVASPINLPHMVDAATYANVINEAASNAGNTPPYAQTTIDKIVNFKPGDSTTTVNPVTNQFNTGYASNDNNDWFKVFFKDNSPMMQHHLSVGGGTDKMSYYFSGGYMDKEGNYRFSTDSYKRYNVLANVSVDVKPWLTVSVKAAYTDAITNSPNLPNGLTGGNNIHQIARIKPNEALINPDGHYSQTSNVPVFLYGGRNINDYRQTELNGIININPLKGLEFTASYNFLFSNNDLGSQIKTVYMYDALGNTFVPPNWGLPNSYSRSLKNGTNRDIYFFGSYERRLRSHYLKFLAGLQSEYSYSYLLSASNSSLYTDALPSLALTSGTTTRNLTDAQDEWASTGIFARLNYNYKEKYLLEGNIRRDGSSKFPAYNKYGVFPSMSAGYVLSNEPYWDNVKPYVNAMKLRASYGSLGDQSGIGSYSFATILPNSASGTWINGTLATPYISGPTTLASNNFTWANPTLLDFGMDATFLKSRLTLVADVYRRRVNDLLGSRGNYPAILGIQPPILNNASIQTDGYEIALNWKDHINGFHYSITASLANYEGKVINYSGNPNGLLSDWIPGRKMGEIWGFETAGLIQDSAAFAKGGPDQKFLYNRWSAGDVEYKSLSGVKDVSGRDSIQTGTNTVNNPGDKTVIGNTTPRYSYGLMVNMSYKNFDLSFFLQGVAHRDIFLSSNMFWGFEPLTANQFQNSFFVENLNRWTSSTPNGYFPKYYFQSAEMAKNTQVQSRYLQDAGYLRVKNVRLSYSIPKSVIQKVGIKRINIFTSAQNLLTFTKLTKSFDPETALGSGNNQDAKIYPLQRTFACGINVTF